MTSEAADFLLRGTPQAGAVGGVTGGSGDPKTTCTPQLPDCQKEKNPEVPGGQERPINSKYKWFVSTEPEKETWSLY